MKTIAVAGLFALHFVCVIQCLDIDLLNKQATYVDAKVGEYAVFNCPLGKEICMSRSNIDLWTNRNMFNDK